MRRTLGRAAMGASVALAVTFAAGAAQAAPCGVTFGMDFAGSYTCNNIGRPDGIGTPLGGLTFLDNNTLLLGGSANTGAGHIHTVGLLRDMDGTITGFTGPSTFYANAPDIDGGLQFGPGGVLFATGFPSNTLLQFEPGSINPDRTINLSPLGVFSSVGSLGFVPAGFAGAGSFKIVSYNGSIFYDASLTPDGMGTYNVTINDSFSIQGGPEGIAYVDGSNAGFGVDSILISEYGANAVGVYNVGANGNPVEGSRRLFLSGLAGAEGAAIDPVTGDFLFSTFGGDNGVYVVSGFVAPPPIGAIPEPATWAMMILGLGLAGATVRRRRVAFA